MQLTQYCLKCGHKMELDFGRRKKRNTCKGCGLRFRYWETGDGQLHYDYDPKEFDSKEVPLHGAIRC